MGAQTRQVLEYIREHGSITQMDAYKFGCTRLAARMADLREEGYKIVSTRKPVTKADGKVTKIAVYSLEEDEA